MNYFKVGQIVNTHGINGVVKVYPYTDDIEKLCQTKEIFLDESLTKKYIVKNASIQKNMLLMTLDGIDDIEHAEKLKNSYVFIKRDENEKLEKDTYYIADLIGLDVIDIETSEIIGNVTDIFSTGANDVYEVSLKDGKKIYLPAISDVVKSIDIQDKKIIVKIMEGLI